MARVVGYDDARSKYRVRLVPDGTVDHWVFPAEVGEVSPGRSKNP